MPIVISPNKLYAKKPDGSGYLSANVISDQTTAEQCAAIEQKGQETIASIPSDYTNLSNQVGDLKSALSYSSGNISIYANTVSGLYISNSGELTALESGWAERLICVEAKANKTYTIKKKTVSVMRAGCGSSASLTSGAQLSSFTQLSPASNDALIVTTTDTDKYIYVHLFINSDSSSVKSIDANLPSLAIYEDASKKVDDITSEIIADISDENGEVIKSVELKDSIFDTVNINAWEQGGISKPNGTDWDSNTLIRLSDTSGIRMVRCASGYKVRVFAYYSDGSYRGFRSTLDQWTTSSSRTPMEYSAIDLMADPFNTYMIKLVALKESGDNITPADYTNFTFEKIKIQGSNAIPLGLHTMPENQGVLNVIKRCRQMTDIKWTPAVDLPRLMSDSPLWHPEDTASTRYYEGVFKAGTEYTGIPYGRANDMSSYGLSYGFVGRYISFEGFITSVSNPNSLLCKESHIDLSDNETTKYALVCSAFVCYALNVAYVATANIPNITGMTTIGKINDNGTQISESEFKLGRLLNLQGDHAVIITDIIKDSTGHIVTIELSEATIKGCTDRNYKDGQDGGICIRKGWDIADIYDYWGDYSILDYAPIVSVPYTPSPFVNVGDELDMYRTEHLPCMPYPGEGFIYRANALPNTDIIISPNQNYEYLRVFKDGTEIANSPFEVTEQTEKISVGFSATGNYEAYLCNMSNGHDINVSMKCHWRVISGT